MGREIIAKSILCKSHKSGKIVCDDGHGNEIIGFDPIFHYVRRVTYDGTSVIAHPEKGKSIACTVVDGFIECIQVKEEGKYLITG